MTTARRRGAALACLTTSLATATGLLLGTAALGAGPASSAEPAGDCTAAFPVSELQDGDAVTGRTVTQGTEPESFTGEVLGVYEDGIAPGLDMVMVEIAHPEVEKAGIWQGMSGSPVYAADGRLIGAVAYGLSFGPSPVAGVTPYEEMDDYLAADAPTQVEMDGTMAARVARATDVSRAQAEEGLTQLPMPVGVSGVRPERLRGVAAGEDRPYFLRDARSLAASGSAAAGPESIVAGGNMAASLSYGDVTQAGVGTATAVCDGRVVGFGHPMQFGGETTLTLHPASTVYVQPDPSGPGFKVANLGAPAGTVTQDRLTGLTGTFGALPETTTISSTVTYGDRSRTGTTHNSVAQAAAGTTFMQILANHDRVVDAIRSGSETMAWRIAGTDVDGTPFELAFEDRYASAVDLAATVGYDVADLVWALSAIDGVELTDVTVDSVVSDDDTTYRVRGVQQLRRGTWVPLSKEDPAVVRAGAKLVLRAVLDSTAGASYVPVTMTVPRKAAGMVGRVAVTGGNSLWTGGRVTSVAKAQRVLAETVRNDEVQVALEIFERRTTLRKTKNAGPADKVVDGRKRVKVFVR